MTTLDSKLYFNIQLLTISTFVSFLSVNSSVVEKLILKWLNKQSQKEKDLLAEKNSLKNEQSSLSIVDQFAKYSKIQRRINLLDEELKQIYNNKPSSNFFVQIGFTYGVKLVLIILLVILSLYYRSTPVFYLGNDIDLTPFSNLICYPHGENHVSFYFWSMCSAAVARLLKKCN